MVTEERARELLAAAERSADLGDPDRDAVGHRLREDAADVIAAVELLTSTDPDAALRLVGSLSFFWQDLGRIDEGRALTDRVLAAAGDRPTSACAEARLVASELAFRQGDQRDATRHAEATIATADAAGAPAAAAMAHLILARVAMRDEDASRIERHAERAALLAPDDPWVRRGTIHMLAWAAHTAGDRGLARRRFRTSAELRLAQGDRFGVAVEEANLGDLAVEDGDLPEAARAFRGVLDAAVEQDSRYLLVNLVPSIAGLAGAMGRGDDAVRMIGAAERVARVSGLEPDPGSWQPIHQRVLDDAGPRGAALRAAGEALDDAATIALARAIIDSAEGGLTEAADVLPPDAPDHPPRALG